jgi:hypothetical protein
LLLLYAQLAASGTCGCWISHKFNLAGCRSGLLLPTHLQQLLLLFFYLMHV